MSHQGNAWHLVAANESGKYVIGCNATGERRVVDNKATMISVYGFRL